MTGFRRRRSAKAGRDHSLSPLLPLLAWVVVVPALMLALGLWESARGQETVIAYERLQTELPKSIVDLRQLAAKNPYASVEFKGAPTLYGAALAATKLEERLAVVERDRPLAHARAAVPIVTIAGALLTLLTGLVGLGGASLAGLWARRSRDSLLASFNLVRRVLPVALGLQVVGLSLAVLSAALFETGGLWFTERFSTGEAKLLLGALLIAGMAVWGAVAAVRGLHGVFALFTPEPLDVSGRTLDEAEAPGLWRFVRELARRQEALEPDAIVLGLTGGFFVTEGAVRLDPEGITLKGRTLYLPAAYLAILNGRELAAVIGHELAHFSGADTAYSRRFAPIYASLHRSLVVLGDAGVGGVLTRPAVHLGFRSWTTFDAAVARWSRAREFEADRRGAVIAGREAAASALLRVGPTGPIIAGTLGNAFMEPDAAGEDLVERALAAIPTAGLPDPTGHLDDCQEHPTDTHPPDRQRIAALAVFLEGPLLTHAARPVGPDERALPASLFSDWGFVCRRLSADFLAQARAYQAAEQADLETMAAAVPSDDTLVYENGRPMVWTMAVLAALLVASGGLLIIYARSLGIAHDPFAQRILAATLGVGIFRSGLYAWWVHRRSRTPLLILAPDALRAPLLSVPVAWRDVADFRVTAGRRLTLMISLAPDAPLPKPMGWFRRASVSRRRRLVTVHSLGARGYKPEAYAALIGRYLTASRARDHLEATGRIKLR